MTFELLTKPLAKIFRSLWRGLVFFTLTLSTWSVMAQTNANQGVAGMKTNAQAQTTAFAEIVYMVAAAMGILMVVLGAVKIYQANKDGDNSRESQTTGWKIIGVGVLSLSLSALIYFVGGTIWGDGQSATQQQRALISK
jgi:Domain of unknown function (DUF4134)